MDLVISEDFPNLEASMTVGSRAVKMLPHHAETISLPLAEGSSSPAAHRMVSPGLGRAGRCHLHCRATPGHLPGATEPRGAVPCWHPWLQAGLRSAGWLHVLRDEAGLWHILPSEPPGGLFAEGDKGWRGLGRTWGCGSCATP